MNDKYNLSTRFIEAYNMLLKQNKVSDKKDFASKIGISSSMMTEISKGRSNVGTFAIQNIVTQFDISADWLLTGQGSMLRNDSNDVQTELKTDRDTQAEIAHSLPIDSTGGIPLIPLSAMAGVFTEDIAVMEYECERYVIPAFKGADFLIQIKGDSMQPTFFSGDLVACQRVPLQDLFFQWNKAYVLDTIQGPLIKRIMPGSDNDHILIVSDNDKYPPFELHRNQFNGVALVRGLVRLE